MPSRRAKLKARTHTLLALVLCGASAALPQTAPSNVAGAEPFSIAIVVDTSSSVRATLDSHGKRLRQALALFEGGFRNLSRLAAATGGAVYTLKKATELDPILTTVRAEISR